MSLLLEAMAGCNIEACVNKTATLQAKAAKALTADLKERHFSAKECLDIYVRNNERLHDHLSKYV